LGSELIDRGHPFKFFEIIVLLGVNYGVGVVLASD